MQDMVICDYCDGRLQRWEATDNPIEEHVRHYGNRCPFMLPLSRDLLFFNNFNKRFQLLLVFRQTREKIW